MSFLRIILGVVLLCSLASAQFTTIQYLEGAPHNFRGLSDIRNAGDINADGIQDFIVGDPRGLPGLGDTGRVHVYSGLDGSLIHTLSGLNPGDRFGESVSGAGDVDGDGHDDFVVGIPLAGSGIVPNGEVRVYSGADGSLLHLIAGPASGRTGLQVAGLGDVNGDGLSDFAIRERIGSASGMGPVRVCVVSGLDGMPIYTLPTNSNGGSEGVIANAGDVDGDGVNDLLVGEPDLQVNTGSNSLTAGGVGVYSGASGTLIFNLHGTGNVSDMGRDVAAAGDLNGDGFADFIVSAPGTFVGSPLNVVGEVRVHSGADASLLQSWQGGSGAIIGNRVAEVGDVDNDGAPDYAISVAPHPLLFPASGVVHTTRLYSGSSGALLDEFPGPDLPGNMGFYQAAVGLGDVDGNGHVDIALGSFSNIPTYGEIRLYGGGIDPISSFQSASGNPPLLTLSWIPAGGNIHDTSGSLVCSGATPGGSGLVVASLAPADIPIFGFDLLTAVDPVNLVLTATLGANGAGEFVAGMVSRRNSLFAGNTVYIQFFETGPSVAASNGIRLVVIP